MVVDPSRTLTPFQEARLEWYALMASCDQQLLAHEREEIKKVREQMPGLPPD
jgi:hypothetical protein